MRASKNEQSCILSYRLVKICGEHGTSGVFHPHSFVSTCCTSISAIFPNTLYFGFFKTFSTTLGFFPSLCFCRELHSHSEKLTSPFKTIFFSKNHLCVTSLKFSPQTHFCKRFQEEYLVYVGL